MHGGRTKEERSAYEITLYLNDRTKLSFTKLCTYEKLRQRLDNLSKNGYTVEDGDNIGHYPPTSIFKIHIRRIKAEELNGIKNRNRADTEQ